VADVVAAGVVVVAVAPVGAVEVARFRVPAVAEAPGATVRRAAGTADRPPRDPAVGGGGRVPDRQPSQRPATPQRPSGSGGGNPSFGGGSSASRPSTLPAQRPGDGSSANRPSTLPAQRPGDGSSANRPSTLPAQRPGGNGDFVGMRPDKPGAIDRPGANRPTTLPGNIDRPGISNRPENRPNLDNRPGQPNRPERPNHSDRWQDVQNNNNNQWNQWKQDNNVQINNFEANHANQWNSINSRYNENGWAGRYGTGEYREWRQDVWDYRGNRCEQIWDRREDFWDDCFDNLWWGSCWWRPRPVAAVSANVSPWWWWRPFAWAGAGVFFGSAIAQQPIVYDPGTTVIYEGDTYYLDGQASGSATEARAAAYELATPEVAEIPVPDPVPEGQPEQWLPLGVWALTQVEQGDATMFMQFSVNKDGLLAGAYKNVLTGDEQPIVGQLDKKTQRVAWHVGEATQTVYEGGLTGMQNDVMSVFVHFAGAQTQTWLLVRIPSPEIPPGPVQLPDGKKL